MAHDATHPFALPHRGDPGLVTRWLFAAIHLLALGIGLGSVWARGRALRGELNSGGLRRAFYADAWWGIAALLWVGTGLVRGFGGLEKGSTYYLQNHLFQAKMGMFLVILVLELRPIVILTRWRSQVRRGETPDTRPAAALAHTSFVQAALVALMVLAATGMARGYGNP
jgi:putative membrane protein